MDTKTIDQLPLSAHIDYANRTESLDSGLLKDASHLGPKLLQNSFERKATYSEPWILGNRFNQAANFSAPSESADIASAVKKLFSNNLNSLVEILNTHEISQKEKEALDRFQQIQVHLQELYREIQYHLNEFKKE